MCVLVFMWVGGGEVWLTRAKEERKGIYRHRERQLELLRQQNTCHVLKTEDVGVNEVELGQSSVYLSLFNCKWSLLFYLSLFSTFNLPTF